MIFYSLDHIYLLNGRKEKKHIGIYSAYSLAESARTRLIGQVGFCDYPDGFKIKRCFRFHKPKFLDITFWDGGFVTIPDDRCDTPPLPEFDEIVERMYDQFLDCFQDTVIEVAYSEDRTKRYVILKDEQGRYTYLFEEIRLFDKYEWKYSPLLPATWETPLGFVGTSIFISKEDAIKELKCEPIYKNYFA